MKKYIGILYNSNYKKFKSKVNHKGITYECGFYDTEREAVLARDKKIIALGLDVKLQILKKVKI